MEEEEVGIASSNILLMSLTSTYSIIVRIQPFPFIHIFFFFKVFLKVFIYLFLAVLGLCCCMQAFSSCERGLLFVAVCRLLIAVASLVAEHGL